MCLHLSENFQYFQYWWLGWPRSLILSLYQSSDQCFPRFCRKIRSVLSFSNNGRSLSKPPSFKRKFTTHQRKMSKGRFQRCPNIREQSSHQCILSEEFNISISKNCDFSNSAEGQDIFDPANHCINTQRAIADIGGCSFGSLWRSLEGAPLEVCWVRVYFGAAATWWLGLSAFHSVTCFPVHWPAPLRTCCYWWWW